MSNNLSIKEQVNSVPLEPGVYVWRDATDKVLYVGKAKRLRDRMKQYVNLSDERAMVPRLMAQVASFEYLVTSSEHESLILERNLIAQYSPPFNVDLKDDKSYPFIAITAGDTFPSIKYTREKPVATTHYFGPYTDARAARAMLEAARRVVPICAAQCVEYKRLCRKLRQPSGPEGFVKACFDYHVGLGPGPCCGAITPEAYAQNVRQVERFLSGHRREFIDDLTEQMQDACEQLDFERAGRLKKRLEAIRSLADKQNVVLDPKINADIIGIYREETIAGVQVLSVREGAVMLSNEFILDKGLDIGSDELASSFVMRYYSQATSIPREVVLEHCPSDAEAIEQWLTQTLASKHKAKVRVLAPERGERHEVLKLAVRNAKHALMRYKVRTRYDDERINLAMLELESALALPAPPMRIECFDISTIHGKHSVASMVVFESGRPASNQYRRFRVRMETDEANDFAMMSETLGRRYAPERMADERFGSRPDLLIVDGGKPQVTAARQQLEALGLDIPLAGLAKADEELVVTWQDEPVILPLGSPSLYLVKQVRDEAHRTAIKYHRELRAKAMTASVLDDIPGLGPGRKKALLKHFGSLKKLRAATQEQIAAVKGIPIAVAQDVFETLHNDVF